MGGASCVSATSAISWQGSCPQKGFVGCIHLDVDYMSLLQLRYPHWSSAAEVKEERTFLFGQEGGGDHVVNSGRQVLGVHITETTSEDEEE